MKASKAPSSCCLVCAHQATYRSCSVRHGLERCGSDWNSSAAPRAATAAADEEEEEEREEEEAVAVHASWSNSVS